MGPENPLDISQYITSFKIPKMNELEMGITVALTLGLIFGPRLKICCGAIVDRLRSGFNPSEAPTDHQVDRGFIDSPR